MSEVYTDFLGNEIREGDYVVYATVDGKSPVQKYARVEVIKTETKTRWSFDGNERKQEEYTHYKIGVKEVSNGRGFRRWDSKNWTTGEAKTVRTSYPMAENIVKAPRPGITTADGTPVPASSVIRTAPEPHGLAL